MRKYPMVKIFVMKKIGEDADWVPSKGRVVSIEKQRKTLHMMHKRQSCSHRKRARVDTRFFIRPCGPSYYGRRGFGEGV